MRRAIGLMAGPDRPPKMVAMRGFRFRASMPMAESVLMMESPSAPPSMLARASATMSVQFGVSLTMSGFFVAPRQARTRSLSTTGSTPNSTPPFLMFGHETFISSASTPSSEPSLPAQSTYSSAVSPKKLTHTRVPQVRRYGNFSFRNPSTPTFSRPIELIMPDAVSQMRGTGLPARGLGEMPLVTIPPSARRSVSPSNSLP